MDKVKNIILWGASQAGKTTALATYLHKKPSWSRHEDPLTIETHKLLSSIWTVLEKNQVPPATTDPAYYPVRHENGLTFRFRDMKGGHTESLQHEDSKELYESDGVLLFVEWPSRGVVQNRIAVRLALNALRKTCPRALVITKVESFLRKTEMQQFLLDPAKYVKNNDVPDELCRLVDSVPPEIIFPISVYGYASNSYPAHYRDEFGYLVPWNINPIGVNLPFDQIVSSAVAAEIAF